MSTTYYGQHSGIVLAGGFPTKNPVTIAANGTITAGAGYGGDAVYGANYAWTLANLGVVAASGTAIGIDLVAGGSVTNGQSGSASGLVAGGVAIGGGAGTVVNYGTILPSSFGIALSGSPGRVVNLGVIQGGATLGAGGVVTNGASGAAQAVVTGGITLAGPGAVTNYGTSGAIEVAASASVANFGTIRGSVLLNSTSGAGDTLLNAGSVLAVAFGDAVRFGGGNDLLIVDPGASFGIQVDGGAGSNEIELAAGGVAGRLLGLGSNYVNFGTVKVDPGARWNLSGPGGLASQFVNDGTILALGSLGVKTLGEDAGASGTLAIGAGSFAEIASSADAAQTVAFTDRNGELRLDQPGVFFGAIAGFQASDRLDLAAAADSYSYSGGLLTLANNGTQVARLRLSTPYAAPVFALAPDGSGGTLVTVQTQPGNVFSGTYTNGIVLSNPATQNPATITATGLVRNSTPSGPGLLGETGFAWTVANYGTILGYAGPFRGGIGLLLQSGGSLRNGGSAGAAALIAGGYGRYGVEIAGGGTIANGPAGIIEGGGGKVGGGVGVVITGGAGTVANLGTIEGGGGRVVGYGIDLASGSITNGQSGSTAGLISGFVGVSIAGSGTVTNFGTIARVGYHYGAFGVAISVAGAAVVTNYGSADGVAIGGGYVANKAGGTLGGIATGLLAYSPASFVNAGLVAATGTHVFGVSFGVYLPGGGAVANLSGGSIAGYAAGLVFNGAGSVGNAGVITASGTGGTGVYLGASGVTLVNTGLISGHYGVGNGGSDTAGDTVVNAGTITGSSGLAVALGAPGDRLVIDPGAVFVGAVYGANSTIELAAGAGALSGLGTNFAGFATVRVDAGADWAVSGGGSRFVNDGRVAVDGGLSFAAVLHDAGAPRGAIVVGDAATAEFTAVVGRAQSVVFRGTGGTVLLDRPRLFHAVVSGFAAGDTIDLVGRHADGLTFVDHQLILTNHGNAIADLRFAGHYRQSDFSLSPDGTGGTDITFAGASAAQADFWTVKG